MNDSDSQPPLGADAAYMIETRLGGWTQYPDKLADAAERLCGIVAPGKIKAWVGSGYLRCEWAGDIVPSEREAANCLRVLCALADNWPDEHAEPPRYWPTGDDGFTECPKCTDTLCPEHEAALLRRRTPEELEEADATEAFDWRR